MEGSDILILNQYHKTSCMYMSVRCLHFGQTGYNVLIQGVIAII